MRSTATAGPWIGPELSLSRGQLRQVAQLHMAVVAFYGLDGVFLTGFGLLRAVPMPFGLLYALAGWCTAGFAVLAFRRGRKRVHELDLNNQAMSACAATQMLATALLAPAVGGLMLMSLMTVLAATALQLPKRELLWMWLALAVGTAATMLATPAAFEIPMSTPAHRLLSTVWFAWLLGKCALINVESTRLRNQASNANLRLRQALADVEKIATTDELTVIPNRRSIVSALQAAIEPGPEPSTAVAVALFDIDHFKLVNDRFGHATGDAVLREFAALVSRGLRPDDRLGRYGGEEFLLVLKQVKTPAAARETAERTRRAVESFDWSVLAPDLRVTASAGVALVGPEESPANAIARADRALYAAKAGGRNRVVPAE